MSAGWQSRGACVGHADLFHADIHYAADGTQMQEPKIVRMRREWLADQLCATCPVITKCRTYALTYEGTYGTPISGFWARMNQADIKHIAAGGKATPKLDPDAEKPRNPGRGGPGVPRPRGPEHGTESGYKRHKAEHTNVCAECRAAHTKTQKEYRARRRELHARKKAK